MTKKVETAQEEITSFAGVFKRTTLSTCIAAAMATTVAMPQAYAQEEETVEEETEQGVMA